MSDTAVTIANPNASSVNQNSQFGLGGRKLFLVPVRIVFFEVCSAFTYVAARTLALSPYFVTRIPKASAISSPP